MGLPALDYNMAKSFEICEVKQSLIEEWKRLRAKLNHDWLQNRFITFLKANKECFDNPVECGEPLDDILDQLLSWKAKRKSLNKFVELTVDALSPRQMLDIPPLCKMRQEDKEWVGPLVHTLYLERTGIEGKVDEIRKLVREIDFLVAGIAANLRNYEALQGKYGDTLLEKVLDLSRRISSLPHDIQVI